ncbi:hypothetical protein LPJ38_09550 [Bradyrhizobium daqingense]|uniref:hypothetical protein n=1 Tax=Bradyrhizobium daqingense TaxID=993502 RepID=UPI0011A3CAEC|nr:hypothetical protein [Bradyrhizobium daqingense]UFS90947.1 hypothetical protein LPJ38_09550 [Bradyrhizobium daqingense]
MTHDSVIRRLIAFGDADEWAAEHGLPPEMLRPEQSRDRRIGQGNATARFLRDDLGVTDEDAIRFCVTELHFGRYDVEFSAALKASKSSGMSAASSAESKRIQSWIRQRPTEHVAHLQTLQAAIEPFLIRKVGP